MPNKERIAARAQCDSIPSVSSDLSFPRTKLRWALAECTRSLPDQESYKGPCIDQLCAGLLQQMARSTA